MKKLIAIFATALMALALPVTAQNYNAQSGITFFVQQSATATATSGAIRLPTFSGAGTLTVIGLGITGSPSGCTIALAYSSNGGGAATSAVSTTSFTPAVSTQTFSVTPSVATGDNYVATYSCSSTYPTAGTITASFSPSSTVSLDPCITSPKSSVAVSITTATTTQLVALAAGKSIYACGFTASLGLSDTLKFEYGTGSTCGTGTTALTGVFTGDAAVVAAPMTLGGEGTHFTAIASNALCALTTGTGGIYGVLTYVQQ